MDKTLHHSHHQHEWGHQCLFLLDIYPRDLQPLQQVHNVQYTSIQESRKSLQSTPANGRGEVTNGVLIEILTDFGDVKTIITLLCDRNNSRFNVEIPREFPTITPRGR